MATEIKMPQLSDTMHSGKILNWSKKEGETIKRGDILAEVETDKANLEIESFTQGTLLKIAISAGETANVGETIAYIGEAGERIDSSADKSVTNGSGATLKPPHSEQTNSPVAITSQSDTITSTTLNLPPSAVGQTRPEAYMDSDRVKASPLARKIARDKNIDLSLVSGSGPAGRIIRRDIEAATIERDQNTAPRALASVEPIRSNLATKTQPHTSQPRELSSTGSGKLTPLSKMRETIARRMQESVTQSPHFYVTTSINMAEVKKLRQELKDTPGFEGISFNHMIIKAAAYALSNEPRVNRAIKNDMMYEPDSINIGIITAIEDGLMIPVLHQADTLSLKDTVFEAKAAIERARAGRPTAQDLSGGTFSISNMGMFDVDSFTAIINPGQGGILAISAIKEEPIVLNGVIVPGSIMKATLSVDHRIIDGVMAGNFLKFFKKALEVPALLMM